MYVSIPEDAGFKEIPFPAQPKTQFFEIVEEVLEEFQIENKDIAISPVGQNPLLPDDLVQKVEDVVDKYGHAFALQIRGDARDTFADLREMFEASADLKIFDESPKGETPKDVDALMNEFGHWEQVEKEEHAEKKPVEKDVLEEIEHWETHVDED